MNYIEKLKRVIKKNKSNLVVGLDPDIRKIPRLYLKSKNPIFEFNKSIINSTKDIVAGYKLNLAFYEALGKYCYETIENTLQYIPKDLLKICDGKRGDIGNTDEYYVKAYFDDLDFDSMTVNPYMGRDSVEPFLSRKDKGIYILVLTSNKGNEDFQQKKIGKKYLFEEVIEKCIEWDKKKQIGFVIGANHTELIKKITTKYPNIPLLIPGIGAQGNDLNVLLKSIKNNNYLINASRSIIYDSADFKSIREFENIVRMKAEDLSDLIG
ncbi:MAG: orotidine-5'-phosphate decarboxylase [Ignavibacteria bacterium]|jgi:orotidine-5'-phosphate decarboxylase